MSDTKIEWCDKVWNPFTGCGDEVISAGCERCYARRAAEGPFLRGRFGYDQDDPFKITAHPNRLDRPLHWKKPQRVFINSMGDLFHKGVPYEWLDQAYDIICRCPQHTFQILTKRPDPMARYHEKLIKNNIGLPGLPTSVPWPLPNLWLGVTAEDQKSADERIPSMMQIPAAVRFVSHEPLLESIKPRSYRQCEEQSVVWAIVGPETGPGRRICRPEWIHDLVNDYAAMQIPIFVKAFPLPDGRISNEMAKWPKWAQRREFPK